MKIHTKYKKMRADLFTPVSLYLALRDKYTHPLLLESSDYHSKSESASVLCFNPLATFSVNGNAAVVTRQASRTENEFSSAAQLLHAFRAFRNSLETERLPFAFPYAGFFGYTAYDAVSCFEHVEIKKDGTLPLLHYSFYSLVIVINHFNDELFVFSHATGAAEAEQNLQGLLARMKRAGVAGFHFEAHGDEASDCTDEDFLQMVSSAKQRCRRGDVFQAVVSRRFSRTFTGDEFEVYRSLRNVNPSPYLYYFDFGNFRLFGSSPEAQLVVKKGIAEVHPIAGTVKRSGDDGKDLQLAEELRQNEKENAEHIMLVDLARNDISRHCSNVKVEKLREVQFYSHVIHLVSKVTGEIRQGADVYEVMKDTFPAGTLSGAPKVRAMQIIGRNEMSARGFYGGAVGFIGCDGSFNHAIIIRSFLSKANTLYYRAGAGVVDASEEISELKEVENKVGALRKAIAEAQAASAADSYIRNSSLSMDL